MFTLEVFEYQEGNHKELPLRLGIISSTELLSLEINFKADS